MYDKVIVGDWQEAVSNLDDDTFATIPLENNGKVKEGDLRLLSEDPGVDAVYFPRDVVPPFDDIPVDQRDDNGFFFNNSDGYPIEMKYRFDEELRDYPEHIHAHNVPELYVADGSFDMALATEYNENGLPEEFALRTIEDEKFVVPGGMYHGIMRREDGSQLAIARGDPDHEQYTVGKWDLGGNQMYDHAEFLEEPNPTSYQGETEENIDELYRMWRED